MDRFHMIQTRTQQVLDVAERMYGVKIQPTVSFKLRGRVAGLAGCRICAGVKTYSLKFNCELIESKHFDDMMQDTVPHEIAHLVAWARPDLGARGHNAAWKRICVALGGTGARCHTYDDVVVRGRWDYLTDLGNKVSITKKYHAYVQSGATLSFKRGLGKICKDSPHAPSGQLKVTTKPDGTLVVRTQPQPVAAPAPKTDISKAPRTDISKAPRTNIRVKTPAPQGEISWAEKVRRLIRAHKPQGISQETVISLAIQDLGMTRERARSCVKAHWHKV